MLLLGALASCGTQKSGVGGGSAAEKERHSDPSVAFVQKVIDNEAAAENITGNASVRLQAGTQNIKLSGALRMRRNEVIRIQLMLPLIGTEVGRLEFTPDYVLLMDRFNKQYVKVGYGDIDFLQKNNITFYSLQSLFWNELVSPSSERASYDDAEAYSIDWSNALTYVPIALSMGENSFQWQANSSDATLSSLVVSHTNGGGGLSMLTWMYSNFTSVAGKRFPMTQEFSFSTTINGANKKAEITIDMSEIKTSSDWEAATSISSKYKEVSAEAVLSRLMSL